MKLMSIQKAVQGCLLQLYHNHPNLETEDVLPLAEWMNKSKYILTIEYYSRLKRNECCVTDRKSVV